MALSEYQYSVQNDFPTQIVDLGALEAEILANSTITTELDGVALDGDDVTVTFLADLPANEKAALDAVVGSHQGAPLVDTPQRVNSLPEQDNADAQWQDAATLAPGTIKGGDWQVAWYCEVQLENAVANSGVFVRLTLNGTERAFSSNALSSYQSFSGSGLLSFADGDQPTLTLQFRRVGAANNAQIRRCQISLVREE